MKILYDLDVTIKHERMGGEPVAYVIATVRRVSLSAPGPCRDAEVTYLDEPATQITRMISCQALELSLDSKGFMKAETDVVADEAMRIAMRRGPSEEWPGFVGLDRAMTTYREKFQGTGAPVKTGLRRCLVCFKPNSAEPGSPCPECTSRKKVNRPLARPPASPATPTITIQGPPCPNCGGTKGWMPGRDECPDCGWDGVTCATDECFALVAAGDSLCPKCVKEGGEWADRVAAGAEDGGRTVFCPDCGRLFHRCAADPACPNCDGIHVLQRIVNYDPTKASKGTCSECNGTGLSEAGGLCPKCKDLLHEAEDDLVEWANQTVAAEQARLRAQHQEKPACPECGGTGEVQLFTSVQPCSRGCRR